MWKSYSFSNWIEVRPDDGSDMHSVTWQELFS